MSVHAVNLLNIPPFVREGLVEFPVYTLSFDGLFRGSKEVAMAGFMCYGWVLQKYDQLLAKGYGVAARGTDATSNIAEYLALIDGLQTLVDLRVKHGPVHVVGDAKVVINQMRGRSRITADRVVPVHEEASTLAANLKITAWRWVPRRQNKAADMLTRRALREFRADRNEFDKAWEQIIEDHAASRNQLRYYGGMLIFPGERRDFNTGVGVHYQH
jgi:ribonuclease HI